MDQRERDELAAFEAMEAGGPPPGEPIAAFSDQLDADAFARYLSQEANIEAHAVRVRGQDGMYYWDIAAPGRALAADVLYRFHGEGVRVGDIAGLPVARRIGMLADVLTSYAIRRGRWTQQGASPDELAWYGEVAALDDRQLAAARDRAEQRFYAQHAGEHRGALWLGAGCLAAAGAWAVAAGPVHVGPILCGAFGLAFFVFGLTRKRR